MFNVTNGSLKKRSLSRHLFCNRGFWILGLSDDDLLDDDLLDDDLLDDDLLDDDLLDDDLLDDDLLDDDLLDDDSPLNMDAGN